MASPATPETVAKADVLRALVDRFLSALPAEVRSYLTGVLYLTVPATVLGALGGTLYKIYIWLYARVIFFVYKRMQVTLRFDNSDKHYDVVLDYIGRKCAVETGRIIASTTSRQNKSWQEMIAGWLGGKTAVPKVYFQPDIQQAFADVFLWTDSSGKAHKIYLRRDVERPQLKMSGEKGQAAKDPESISLTMWFTTDPTPLREFMTTAMTTMLKEDSDDRVDIYVKHRWIAMWTRATSKEKRSRETIVLDEKLADYVIDDMKHFYEKKTADWYLNAGIPYRRGYLLYGPPGCGKTSFAQVLAGELGLDICIMNLSNQELDDDDLAELLRNAPGRSMLLLEDVDAIFVERAATSERRGRGGGVSFSGLLNALDGAAAQEGCVIMLTTNHKDRLDEALIRPGRCDVHVKIDKANQDQARRMFIRFFANQGRVLNADGQVLTLGPHAFQTGDQVTVRGCDTSEALYVRCAGDSVTLYSSESHARSGESKGLVSLPSSGKLILQTIPASAERFGTRIPSGQVSMAKLQGYLMKQTLLAEEIVKRGSAFSADDIALHDAEVHRLAAETAVMNVHELLEVNTEAEDVAVPIFEHLRRVGLHRFATLFEHFGIRVKADLTSAVKDQCKEWHPDLKLEGHLFQRLAGLISGDDHRVERLSAVADLSVLRDRFLEAYKISPANRTLLEPPQALARDTSSVSSSPSLDVPETPGSRKGLLRMTSRTEQPSELELLDLAHSFQEKLERKGKTDVTIWQLEAHFQRFAGDAQGAVAACGGLLCRDKDRAPEARKVLWTTTFAFLRRIGLEQHAFAFEGEGYVYWMDLKKLDKDKLKELGDMSKEASELLYDVLSVNKSRQDRLRQFTLPEFHDLLEHFRARFPGADKEAQAFAVSVTDDLGATEFSHHQVLTFLAGAATAADALAVESGLVPTDIASAARVKPAPPAPRPEPTDWVFVWLKSHELQHLAGSLQGEALLTQSDVLAAPLDHDTLKAMGVNKLGERCKLLRLIESLRQQ